MTKATITQTAPLPVWRLTSDLAEVGTFVNAVFPKAVSISLRIQFRNFEIPLTISPAGLAIIKFDEEAYLIGIKINNDDFINLKPRGPTLVTMEGSVLDSTYLGQFNLTINTKEYK